MKTPEEYIASQQAMKHNVWMNGRKVERPWEHPQIVPGVTMICRGVAPTVKRE